MVVEQFLLLADALPEVLVLVSADGTILSANRATYRHINSSAEDFIGKHITDVLDNPAEKIRAQMPMWLRSRKPLPTNLIWSNSNKTHGGWRSHGFLLVPGDNDTPASIVLRSIPGHSAASDFNALNRELERERNALRKLEQSRDALETEHEKAVVTLLSIGDAVITTDSRGNIEYLNPVAENLTGWSSDEANGRPLLEVFNIINEMTRKPASDPVARCLREGSIVGLANHTALLSRDGKEYVIEDSAAPIITRSGGLLGTVLVFRDATKEKVAKRQLEYLAHHDALTGLHNRYYFEQQLQQIVHINARRHSAHAMLYIDLDQFKIVNDTSGHGAGDELLCEVTRLFSRRTRQGDVLARLGGDEFGLILYNVDAKTAENVAQSFRETMEDYEFNWEDNCYEISPSIGIAMISSETVSPAEVMRQADIACYIAKQAGRNQCRLYQAKDDDHQTGTGAMGTLGLMRRALVEDQFELWFQPIVRKPGDSPSMHEVTLRMVDDEGTIINPMIFIPVAERYGLMHLVDQWVINHITDIIAKQKYAGNTARYTVNLSASSLSNPELLRTIEACVEKIELVPGELIFEITETTAVGQIEKASEFMHKLIKLGCQFALDDFGTGFSSFSYLKYLPVEYVKIDGTFVRDIVNNPVDQAMVRSINQIAHSLGMKTIAEYVENQKIVDELSAIGVDYMQGYYTGRPDPKPVKS